MLTRRTQYIPGASLFPSASFASGKPVTAAAVAVLGHWWGRRNRSTTRSWEYPGAEKKSPTELQSGAS